MSIETNTDEAIEFLQWWSPGGPWSLTAIPPSKSGIRTRAFTALDEARAFIEEHNGKSNLYFTVNPVRQLKDKKPSAADISHLAWLHVDLDPRAGEDIDAERQRILGLLCAHDPEPSCIIDSGGGYQGFWRLDEPLPIDDPADAKLWNIALERALGGDNCHNIDRVMRLPGTVNLPNAKKAAKGRVPTLAHWADHGDRVYPLSRFSKSESRSSAPEARAVDAAPLAHWVDHGDRVYPLARFSKSEAQSSVTAEPALTAVPRRIEELSELDEWNVPNRVKIIIAQGSHPDEPKDGDNSRSAWLFDVCCNLVRCGVPDDIILGLLLDPEWGISESVLELGPGAEKYARRQIERAKKKRDEDAAPGTLDDEIARINKTYLAALAGGKVRFWRENPDNTIEPMDKSSFLFELATRRYRDPDDALKPVAPVWMARSDRRYFPRGFILDPHAGYDGPAYNLWRGFALQPKPGDWSLMQQHIEEVIASGNTEHAKYILDWTAWSLQNPATPPRVALVFRGGQGVGKGMFAGSLVDIFGSHGMRIQSMQHLVGKFNAHLRHLCLLFADEAIVPNSDGQGAMNGLITEPTIPIESKGVDVVNDENHLHIVMATNNDWAVSAAADARRYAVFDVSEHRRGDHEYFAALAGQMQAGGMAAMLHALLEHDLADFHPERCRPFTDALSAQMDLSMGPVPMVVHNMLLAGEVPCDHCDDWRGGTVFVPTRLLLEKERLPSRDEKSLGQAIRVVAGAGAKSKRSYITVRGERRQWRGFWLPPLELARQNWERHLGRTVEWPEDIPAWDVDAGDDHEHF